MPRIYLSPSLQEYNPFINGGSEEEVMNLIADAMEPYLAASGIEVVRNSPEMSLGEAIADSNASNVDFHLAIHSNASPPSIAGTRQGPVVYYYSTSQLGREMAEDIADEMREIYPDPSKVQVLPTTTLRELRRTNAPSALVEVAYHDNYQDANWIKENIQPIARALSEAAANYFGVPFVEPTA
ncbi:N-acetylmuramoyl-L-alanine amidase family protein [Anaerotignum sp.]|nr:N-acetylmuramoyl-L-alanine amidase [Anaerotignum sp.]MBQ7757453.1 N-acetylmuramoyl-L-alanine amidase [Anaerotignum sp.]